MAILLCFVFVVFFISEVVAKIMNIEGLLVMYFKNALKQNQRQILIAEENIGMDFFKSEYRALYKDETALLFILCTLKKLGFVVNEGYKYVVR